MWRFVACVWLVSPPGGDEATAATQEAWETAGWGNEPSVPESEEPPTEEAAWDVFGEGPASDSSAKPIAKPPEEPSADEGTTSKAASAAVGDVLAGSLRLTGSFLHFDDEPLLFPTGDDALAIVVGRILVEADPTEHVHVSFNGFGEMARVPFGGGLSGTFASAGSTESAYRLRYLTWTYWDNGSVRGQLGVDRMGLRLHYEPVNIDIGRLPVSYTVTGIFSTNDFFAPFSATAVNRIYKPGVDTLRVSVGVTPTSNVDAVGVLGYDPDTDLPSWGQTAVLMRGGTVVGGFALDVLGGKVAQRWVAGGAFQGDAGPVNLRAEFHVGIPDADGDGHDETDQPIYGRVAGGPSMIFAWHNTAITAEYMFASDGSKKPAGYVDRALSGYSDDLPYLGRHYVGLGGGTEIIPILRFGMTGLVSATDGSGLVGASLQYNVANESDLIFGAFVPWGRGLDGVDAVTGIPELGSEFGLSPITAYLEARVFF